jgi:hypothetical protein
MTSATTGGRGGSGGEPRCLLTWFESVPSGLRWFCLGCKASPVTGLDELEYEAAHARMQHDRDCRESARCAVMAAAPDQRARGREDEA